MGHVIELVTLDGQHRVSSMDIASSLGIQHKNVLELLRRYRDDFAQFARGAFETRPFETPGGSQSREVAMLSEDQCGLLLAYSRNTAWVRSLKVELVRTFGRTRREGISRLLAPPITKSRAAITDPQKVVVFWSELLNQCSAACNGLERVMTCREM